MALHFVAFPFDGGGKNAEITALFAPTAAKPHYPFQAENRCFRINFRPNDAGFGE